MLTTAEVRLANIKPVMRIAILSLNLKDATITASKTRKLPVLEAITIAHFDNNNPENELPNTAAPRMTHATPRLAPLLRPRT